MKYLIIFGTYTNNLDKFYIVFNIKGVTKKDVKHYMENFLSELRYNGEILDISWRDEWNNIKENLTRFDGLFSLKNDDLKDIKTFLFFKRYPYFEKMFRLEKKDLNTDFLSNFAELTIL